MKRRKSPLVTQLEYYPLRGLLFFLQHCPKFFTKPFCRGLLQSLISLFPKRQQRMDAELQACFPHYTAVERKRVLSRSIDNLGDGLATFARLPSFRKAGNLPKVQIDGAQYLEEALSLGKGVITFTAHYGCWELMAHTITHLYPRVAMLVRPLDNQKLEDMVRGVRQSGGGTVFSSADAFKMGAPLLRQNGILGVLVDQNFYRGGIFVDFFGRMAASSPLVPILARRTGCTLIPMHNRWEGNHTVRIISEPALKLSKNPDAHQAIAEDTQALAKTVERWVREDPCQWLWLHNRWKRRPQPGDDMIGPQSTPAATA